MSRQRNLYPTDRIAHLWAHKTDEARRIEAKRFLREEMPQLVEAWRRGKRIEWQHRRHLRGLTLLRINGENVETSLGAEFPVNHAIRVMPLVERILASGRAWQTNGHSIHLGHYQIDSIDADGTLHAGCHHVKRDELERLISELKKLEGVTV